MPEDNFYKDLSPINLPLAEVFKAEYFSDIPGSWFAIIADVKNSTAAVNAGKHNDVNLVAASSLVVCLNIAKAAKIEIPFFFTGDGGTVFVPGIILPEILQGLRTHNENSMQNFQLQIHFGCISLTSIKEAGYSIQICKVQFGKNFTKAVIIGNALKYAEQVIKESTNNEDLTETTDTLLNMDGLECRWDKIKAPGEMNEIVCYLIEANDHKKQVTVYGNVLQKMDEIFGGLDKRNPLSIDRLKLMLSVNKLKKEMLVRFGKWKKNYFTAAFLRTFIGQLYFRFNWRINNLRGQQYLEQVITNADTLTIDGRINTIISSSMEKRIKFVEFLNAEEKAGNLIFGHFISRESVMTCYIENRDEKHIHFVDGADGGYTEASKELKNKLRNT